MGCLDDGNFGVELDNGVKLSCIELGLEGEPETVAIEEAVKVLLQGLGEDINREGLLKTPLRVAKALRQGTTGYKQKVKDIVQGALFPEPGLDNAVGYAGGVGGLVVVRDLDLFSYCETCLIPFQIKCHVGYVPCGQRVIGLSKLSRVADTFAKRLQDPWRLVDEICSALDQGIKPAGVAVLLQCSHLRFPNVQSFFLDSNHQGSVKVLVSSGSGVFENEKADAWSDFFSLMRFRGISVDKMHMRDCTEQCWCPFRSSSSEIFSSNVGPANPGMIAAATSILRSLGEDPSRKELIGTPSHFVNWLMNFQNTNFEMKLNDPVYGKNDNNIRSNGEIIHDEEEIIQNEEQLRSELNLPFWSQCEHHLLPFHGVVHIGYFSAGRINPIGRSLLQSVVHFYGFKLQAQERLSRQIAQTVSSLLGDVMVLVEANHTCMISRGIEKVGSNTATVGVVGRFSTDPSARCMFLKSIPNFATSAGSDFSSTA